MSTNATLVERQTDLTEQLILDAALRLLERASVAELTVRAVAKEAGMSERTVFRYFATREAFLDAIAGAVRQALNLPPEPQNAEDLVAAPHDLYAAFEAKASLTKAALHSELFHRMRESQAKERWMAVIRIVNAYAPRRAERERRIAAANIRYYLSATTWHYYRSYFRFALDEAIACAEAAIEQSLNALRKR